MAYPGFTQETPLLDTMCPVCRKEKEPRYIFCNYDCYVEGFKNIKSGYDKSKILFPILFNTEFKHIPPKDADKREWNEEKRKWELKK